jgi:hypothetical protein
VEAPKPDESPVEQTLVTPSAYESADPASPTPAETNETRPHRRSRWRLVLLVILAVVGVTCVGGAGAGYFLYYKASEPDRSTPTVVVRQYLEAVLNQRSDQLAARFSCDGIDDGELRALMKDVKDREQRFGIAIRPSWENFQATTNGGNGKVAFDLRLSTTVDGVAQREVQRWEFRLINRSGWRVCKTSRIS